MLNNLVFLIHSLLCMLKKLFKTVSCLLLISSNLNAEINFERIGAANGLSQISVLSIYQDKLGYMWFGTREGLNRYDGKNIKIYLSKENDKTGFSSNIINSICGNDDKLYILCGYHQVVEYDTRFDKFRIISDNSQHIGEGKDNLWMSRKNVLKKMDYKTGEISDYYKIQTQKEITFIYEASNKDIYIGTESGLCILDKNKTFSQVLENNFITTIFEDSKQNIWIGTDGNGVFRISKNGSSEQYSSKSNGTKFALSNDIVRAFSEDDYGQIWIGTFNGLNCLIPENGQISIYSNKTGKPTELSHNSVFSIFKDKQGTIWIGTFYGGVNYYNPEFNFYTYFYPSSAENKSVNFPIVGKMTEDGEKNLWICTEGGGLNFYDRKNKVFKYYKSENSGLSHNNVKCIWYNKDNNKLYIGTHLGGLNIFDIKTNRFKNITKSIQESLPNNIVDNILPYNGKLIIFTHNGIVQLDMETEKIEPFFKNQKIVSEIFATYTSTFFIDSKDNVWISLTEGGLYRYNIKTETIEKYTHSFDSDGSIGRHMVSNIYETKYGNILFSTLGSGLFEYIPHKNNFKRYSVEKNGLLSNFIYKVTETNLGRILLLTNSGVNLLDNNKNSLYILNKDTGFPLEKINSECGVCITENGEIYVGGTNGMASFYENQINFNPKDYNLFFSEVYINNKLLSASDDKSIIKNTLPYLKELNLKHNQTNLLIQLATSNNIKLSPKNFEYKLEGIDNTWNPSDNQNIRYSNLKSGKYLLRVREQPQQNSLMNSKEITLKINVLPPFYSSSFAFIFYFLIVSLVIWSLMRLNKMKIKLKTSLEYEIKENNKIQELNQAKFQFFTNVSHEFRTPLTLIVGQIESLIQMDDISSIVYNKLTKVQKSAAQLISLVTELLDFRKQESNLLKLRVAEINIVDFAKLNFNSFKDLASKMNINYTFNSTESKIMIWFDPLQMQKVIYNLLSNAFKYSEENGEISLTIERRNNNQVVILVRDSGFGIAEEDLSKIFERFYQGKNTEKIHNKGTGIGLSLTKGIVDLHHGIITAYNNPDRGSTFTVTLQGGGNHFSSEEKTSRKTSDWSFVKDSGLPDQLFFEEFKKSNIVENADSTKFRILIVEDDEDILNFLVELFSPIYYVETAKNGKEAIDKVNSIQPDIVLSDIMMPKMSGKELCSKLKSNFESSHIPVVLITADISEEQNLDGLLAGADDFITKPFNVKALISRCNNLVLSRKRMQEIYSKQIDNTPIAIATNKRDQELLNLAIDVIGKFLDDTEFNVNTFATEMALSRSKLFLKIKSLTGMTPNDFIINTRLKKAATLLLTSNDLNVSDISHIVGFNTPRYFSKCFKELFGMSPLNYRRTNGV